MKSSHWAVVLLLLGLVVGFAVGGGVMERKAEAQGVPIRDLPARFQISAWGYAAATQVGAPKAERGCYIVDTVTGELWHAAADGQPKKISEKLR